MYTNVNPPGGDTKMNTTLHRLKIARGHLDKVIDMVTKNAYCIDVVHQSIAVQSALKKIDELILENHLKTCVADSIKKGEANDAIKEVMEVLKKK
ncbi:MAG: hypothetical protein ACD_19C00184G0001 [uncultured bacterium]|nr:MAG: hypothetical protein ACD_19C00184G0001 [uncultured bacterium]